MSSQSQEHNRLWICVSSYLGMFGAFLMYKQYTGLLRFNVFPCAKHTLPCQTDRGTKGLWINSITSGVPEFSVLD